MKSDFDISEPFWQMRDAVGTHDIDAVARLLAGGMDVNIRDDEGDIALMWAADEGDIDMIKFLLVNGADVFAINDNGDQAINMALLPDVYRLLKAAMTKE